MRRLLAIGLCLLPFGAAYGTDLSVRDFYIHERLGPATKFVPLPKGNYQVLNAHETRMFTKKDLYQWYELTDEEDAKLRVGLKNFHPDRPILILSATADSLALAEDFDSAFKDAGFKSSIDKPMDTVDGLHCTSPALANIIVTVTKIPVVIDVDEAGLTGQIVLNFGRKVKK